MERGGSLLWSQQQPASELYPEPAESISYIISFP
jgi:hypothetical protein